MVPGVLLFVFMGAWLGAADLGSWITCVLFGVLGFFMKRGGLPRPPVILALVLGPILERTFQISTSLYGGFGWFGRPIVIVLLVIIVLSVVLAARSIAKKRKSTSDGVGEGYEKNPAVSLPLSVLLLGLFTWGAFAATQWPPIVKQFPMIICVPGILLGIWMVIQDSRHLIQLNATNGNWGQTLNTARKDAWLTEAMPFFGYLAVMIALCLLIGQKLAMPIFIGIYLVRWGGYSKRLAIAYALGAWAILVFFYGQVMSLIFHVSLLEQAMQTVFPRGFPDWLLF